MVLRSSYPKTSAMKLKLWLIPLFSVYFLFTSATTSKTEIKSAPADSQASTIIPSTSNSVKAHTLNFFQRLALKIFVRKHKEGDVSKADKLASTSLALGIGTFVALLLGAVVPYLILATIPLGIAAMVTGSTAVKGGTSKVGKAKTGKALGLGGLITFAVLAILATIALSSSDWW
jgi:hypothetical protein